MSGGPIALIVDEAQQALLSEAGESAMYALKAARDAMNSPDRTGLMLVMTGSDRDKLLRLTNTGSAPFYGSDVERMPLLGADFVRAVATDIESADATLAPVDTELLGEAFTAFGHRPQLFTRSIGAALSPLAEPDQERFERLVLARARERLAEDRAQMSADYRALGSLEQVVLWRILERRERFRPYDADALAAYAARLDEIGVSRRVTVQTVQTAINRLRERTPSLVWKSARGEYAPEDAAMHAWYDELVAARDWPPISS